MWRTGPLATMHFIQACYPHTRDRDAAVINFVSGAGVSGNVEYAAYGPAKEGIRSLTKVAGRGSRARRNPRECRTTRGQNPSSPGLGGRDAGGRRGDGTIDPTPTFR